MSSQRDARWPKRDERSGTWWFVVDVGIDPATGQRRRARRQGFATKREASEALTVMRGEALSGVFVPKAATSFGEYLEQWLATLPALGLRPNTIASYSGVLRGRVIPRIGAVKLQRLSPLDLDRLYAELLESGRADGRGGLSPRSVRYVHAILSHALSDAERKGVVGRNVARLADPPAEQTARRELHTWTPDELAAFLKVAATDRLSPAFRLLALTGMRRSEVAGVRWVDLDLDAARVSVRQAITTADYELVVAEPKTARGRRSIDLDQATVSALRAWRAVQLEERMLVGAGWRDHGLVFTLPSGDPVHPNTIGKTFDALVRRSKLPRIRLHDLRHTHASHLLAAGANPKIVSERLGHSSVSFTLDRYSHVMPGQQADAAAAVAALVDGR